MSIAPNKHKYSDRDNNALRGTRDIRLEPTKKDKVFESVSHTYNPLIHKMIPNPNGKGFIQKLKADL